MVTLSDWRKEQGISIPALAKQLNASLGATQKWLRREREPRPRLGRRIVQLSQGRVTLEDLYSVDPGATAPLLPDPAAPDSAGQPPPDGVRSDPHGEIPA